MNKSLPIGISDFKKIVDNGYLYIEQAVASAIEQIENKNYAQDLLDRGIHQILYLGLAFKGKCVLISHKK